MTLITFEPLLSSALAKIFDWVIMIKSVDAFKTNYLQFGFKPQNSTAKCTFALMETVNYFQQNKSDVYVLLLDATKAFDKVNYVKTFLFTDGSMNESPSYQMFTLYVH